MFVKHIILYYITLSLHLYIILVSCSCETKSSCLECIQDPDDCVWCAMSHFNGTRCRPRTDGKDWCPEPVQDPENSGRPSSNEGFNSTPGFVVQIKPQSYKMKLRPGKPYDFNFSFQGVKNFPVDLYFLLDSSDTMAKIKSETAEQSKDIYFTLKNMTNDVSLGFGSFVDKRLYPFTLKFNSNETYSFKHRLKLTKDFQKFEEVVSRNPNGFNRDEPEGGFDALAQVMACKEVVEWRNESRKIIVFLTNAPYHTAGDGKSAGLFQPYDGKCYTDNDTYTNELTMDYPSVGMINKLASEHDIIIVFLIKGVYDIYKELQSSVRGSHVVDYGDDKSKQNANIVQILEDVYKNITKKIKLKVNHRIGKRKNFEISFTPNCTTDDSDSDCNVKKEEEQQFRATIKLLRYDNLTNNVIDIMVEGLGEKLTLDVEMIKNCECESHSIEKSPYCFGEVQQCGICKCSENRYGERCGCAKNGNNTVNDNSTCINKESNLLCSGHGSCICGTCNCREEYEGKFCECNKHSCKLDEKTSKRCSDHGKCVCGNCVCEDGWMGDACQCANSTAGCLVTDGYMTNICNHRGRCVCGACECHPIAQWDVRSEHDSRCKMQPCTDCHTLQCSVLKKCVLSMFQDEECSLDSCPENINTSLVGTLPESYLNSTEWKLCTDTRVKVGCYTRFVYRYNDQDYGMDIVAQRELNCDENYLIYGGICLGTLLLVGLTTLVAWKLLTEARDRREYEDFKKLHGEDHLSEHINTIYVPPRTVVKNPMFRKPSVDVRVR